MKGRIVLLKVKKASVFFIRNTVPFVLGYPQTVLSTVYFAATLDRKNSLVENSDRRVTFCA